MSSDKTNCKIAMNWLSEQFVRDVLTNIQIPSCTNCSDNQFILILQLVLSLLIPLKSENFKFHRVIRFMYELWYGSRFVKVTSIRSFLLSAILLLTIAIGLGSRRISFFIVGRVMCTGNHDQRTTVKMACWICSNFLLNNYCFKNNDRLTKKEKTADFNLIWKTCKHPLQAYVQQFQAECCDYVAWQHL